MTVHEQAKRYNHIISETDAAYHEAALKLGLSDSRMMILYTLADNGGVCLIGDITRWTGLSKQTVNSALRKLEADGIIVLETAVGRAKRICLTERGDAIVENTVKKIIAIENSILASWKKEELALYLELAERFLTAFKQEIKELSYADYYH